MSNLGDLKNPSLRQNVISGQVPPSRIAVMTSEVYYRRGLQFVYVYELPPLPLQGFCPLSNLSNLCAGVVMYISTVNREIFAVKIFS